jgi:hypothetical protein
MINFEKWRDGLTPEDLLNQKSITRVSSCVFHCRTCPAYEPCAKPENTLKCREYWLNWANAEVSEAESCKSG